ncbi:MAG: response regulator [Myxococcaceae bacterium]
MNPVTLFVDDQEDFLSALSFTLPPEKGPYLFMTDPLESLKCLQEKNNNIGVIFMDYMMPVMTGLEVFEQIPSLHAERILLTGKDEEIAIQALNRGLIHRYMSKRDPQVIQNMLESIEIGQKNYFERCQSMLKSKDAKSVPRN